MTRYRPIRLPDTPTPELTESITLIVPASPVVENYDAVRVGDHTSILLDHGPRGARIDPPEIADRLHVAGLGKVSETRALELATELLTGVVELRRRRATDPRPFDPTSVTGAAYRAHLSVAPLTP